MRFIIKKENDMKIYTLNINGFRGSDKGIYDCVDEDELEYNLDKFKILIHSIICDSESVIILQEVPYKIPDKSAQHWQWNEKLIYKKFISAFSNEYRVIKPNHLIDSYQCTIALCSIDSLWDRLEEEIIVYDQKYNYANKLVELQYNKELSLLGLHMNPSDEMWDLIFNSYKKRKHTFVVGDFNAYEARGTMKNKPQQLRDFKFNSCIPNNVITDLENNSSIDNIYIDKNLKLENMISISVKKLDVFKTNHTLCSIEIDNREKN